MDGPAECALARSKDERQWLGRVALIGLDPRKRLSRVGGVTRYNTNYVLRQSVRIDATIDVRGWSARLMKATTP